MSISEKPLQIHNISQQRSHKCYTLGVKPNWGWVKFSRRKCVLIKEKKNKTVKVSSSGRRKLTRDAMCIYAKEWRALNSINMHVNIKDMRQVLGPGALGRPRGIG